MSKSTFLKLIHDRLHKESNWEIEISPDYIIIFSRLTGLRISIGLENDIPEIYFYLRTTSWDYEGDRSDLHDIISTLLSVFFKLNLDISCAIFDVPHPAIETSCEIYARYIIPQQFDTVLYKKNDQSIDKIIEIIEGVSVFELVFWQMAGCSCDECREALNPPFN